MEHPARVIFAFCSAWRNRPATASRQAARNCSERCGGSAFEFRNDTVPWASAQMGSTSAKNGRRR